LQDVGGRQASKGEFLAPGFADRKPTAETGLDVIVLRLTFGRNNEVDPENETVG
jgi:hypothetical protein